MLKELLRFFPSLIMTTDVTNSTALHTSAAQGHVHVVNLLLDIDSNLAKIARNNGKTVLHTAARMGHLEVVKSLLKKDPTIGFRTDRKGQTALHMAVKGQNVDIVLELIKPDPTVLKLEDNKGNTALHIATRKCRIKVCSQNLAVAFFTFSHSKTEEAIPHLSLAFQCFSELVYIMLPLKFRHSIFVNLKQETNGY